MRRTVRVCLVAAATTISFTGIAHAAPAAEVTISGAILSPAFLAEELEMEEFEGAPLVAPPDHAACGDHRAAIERAIEAQAAGEDAAVHEEWHTPDAAYTVSQTGFYYIPSPDNLTKYFGSLKKKPFAECIEAINGEFDENPSVVVNIDVEKSKKKIKSADDSVIWEVEGEYLPTEAPASYGRSVFIFASVDDVVVSFVYAHFSMDRDDLDDFAADTKIFIKAVYRQF